MIRMLGGIVAGMAAAITLIMIIEAIGNQIAPPPARLDLESLAEAPPLPVLTLAFPVLAALIGTLAGGFVAIRMSGRKWTAIMVAAAVFAASAFNFALMRYPLWLMVAGLAMPVIGALLALRLSRPGRTSD